MLDAIEDHQSNDEAPEEHHSNDEGFNQYRARFAR